MTIVPLAQLDARRLGEAGGKGANLGELSRAGIAVPDGFVLTTAAYASAAERAEVDPTDPSAARERILGTAIGEEVASAVRDAYRGLGGGRVAVRSSATAEDLPGASFAGQQDTFLNVEGADAVLAAVRGCWASLWNERAVAYRRANGIADRDVALAVVVQRMVDASAAGVLFTADPITGRRRRAVVDAVRGLGEALVSGAVNPDHYVVDAKTGDVLERRGDVLDDGRLVELASVGARVETHFGAPQDIEWAIDRAGALWLVQSRPITTLYPLPANAPDPDTELRVYFSANVAQGMFGPFTPMGVQTFRLISASLARALGHPLRDPLAGAPVLAEAGLRLWIDVTPALRDPLARRLPERATEVMEARSAAIFRRLLDDPRLRPRGSPLRTFRRAAPALIRTGAPGVVLRAFLHPDATRERILREVDAIVGSPLDAASSEERVDAFERLFLTWPARLFPKLIGLVAAGLGPYNLLTRVLRGVASPAELQTVLRGLPHDPTTEMDLALWSLARRARDDADCQRVLASRTPEELADAYRAGGLPPILQGGLAAFLARYGHRAVAEIDLGLPRWSEDPAHLMGAIVNYLRLADDALAPDAQFERGAREAEAMSAELLRRVRGPKRRLVRALLRRVRALAGCRELPKFEIIRLFARGRALLAPVGAELVARGRLASSEDLWFLTLADARRALAGEDVRTAVTERRAAYRRELARRHVPRVLLSDGTEPEAELAHETAGALRGTPASPGLVTAPARVLRSPQGARLEPGEVLVAPSTDPGWTPLFLTAGGLVMEMGGMMSHGAVVAREYGIPAVVGVAGATERIASGDRVTVDGAAGTVAIEPPAGAG